jgi:hypothetical protein
LLSWSIAVFAYVSLEVSRADADIISNLLAHYPFSGDAADVSGNGHDGAVFGATLTTDRFDNPQSAYSFDGNDRIDVPDDPRLTLGAGPFTLAAWVRLSQFGADGGYYLIGHSTGPGSTSKWIFWVGSSGISLVVGPAPGWISLGSGSFELARWYHVAIIREANTLTAYVDGAPIGSAQLTVPIPDPGNVLQIGTAEPDRPNRPVRGSIDDVRIYSRALSASDIGELIGPITTGCVDTDDDGEADSGDACPDTPVGAEVDSAGCSVAQFCAQHDATSRSGQELCKLADWLNDEPRMKKKGRDCDFQKGKRGSEDDRCVPR